LTSTNYQTQHDRQGIQNKRLLEDALLVQNKILTQQIEQLTTQMAKLPQQLHAVNSSESHSHPIRCDFCGDDHPNGHCTYQSPRVLYFKNYTYFCVCVISVSMSVSVLHRLEPLVLCVVRIRKKKENC